MSGTDIGPGNINRESTMSQSKVTESVAQQEARKAEARKILGGDAGLLNLGGKNEPCRVTRRGMIAGTGKRNKNLEVDPLNLRLASPVSSQVASDHHPGAGINAVYGRGMKFER